MTWRNCIGARRCGGVVSDSRVEGRRVAGRASVAPDRRKRCASESARSLAAMVSLVWRRIVRRATVARGTAAPVSGHTSGRLREGARSDRARARKRGRRLGDQVAEALPSRTVRDHRVEDLAGGPARRSAPSPRSANARSASRTAGRLVPELCFAGPGGFAIRSAEEPRFVGELAEPVGEVALPGPSVPRPGSARRRGRPGSTPRPPPSPRSPAPGPGRGARRGRRPGWRPRAAGRRAKRRGGGAPRSKARRVFGLMEASGEAARGRRRALGLGRGGAARPVLGHSAYQAAGGGLQGCPPAGRPSAPQAVRLSCSNGSLRIAAPGFLRAASRRASRLVHRTRGHRRDEPDASPRRRSCRPFAFEHRLAHRA